ncbi:LLM class flavin-dependent oxidoreductase [Rhodococcus sp. LB1]|uniref:LLM class flavin-dependent oxidoreductase n=1 Tax=Rhodococcus sp. LB1 TaxID=1807499 RepID=UPI001E41962E|nr:LLM class flavin-dependent oxidoreductase [Rhodococcus sp. LB1]
MTERVRLGTSVMVAGLDQPLQLAKRFATLDQISGGVWPRGWARAEQSTSSRQSAWPSPIAADCSTRPSTSSMQPGVRIQ